MSLVDAALRAWGVKGAPRLIKDRENAVYEMCLPDGTRAALRLHRAGYQSAQAIRSELWWMRALAQAGLPVPPPVPTKAGDLLFELPGGRVATAIGWCEGVPLGEADVPLAGTQPEKTARFHAVGRMIANLHNATDALTLPDSFARHAWDIDGLLGEEPFWGRFWESPALDRAERRVIDQARDLARQRLTTFRDQGGDYGLIHADVLRENVLFDGAHPSLIDFDDCGFGFRMYDLATLASQNENEPDHTALMQAAITGYRSARPLPDDAAALLAMFILLRRFASMGWVVPRTPAADPKRRLYAERALGAARAFLIGT